MKDKLVDRGDSLLKRQRLSEMEIFLKRFIIFSPWGFCPFFEVQTLQRLTRLSKEKRLNTQNWIFCACFESFSLHPVNSIFIRNRWVREVKSLFYLFKASDRGQSLIFFFERPIFLHVLCYHAPVFFLAFTFLRVPSLYFFHY